MLSKLNISKLVTFIGPVAHIGRKIDETDRPDLILAWKAVKGLTELQRHLSARESG